MSDDPRADEAPQQSPSPGQPSEPASTEPREPAHPSMPEAEAAENTAAAQASFAPPATGPAVQPPPVAGWADSTSTQPFPAPPDVPAASHMSPGPAEQPSGARGIGPAVVAALLVALVIGAFAGLAGGFLGATLLTGAGSSGGSSFSTTTVRVVPSTTDQPAVAAAAAASPSVVDIDISAGVSQGGQNGLPSTHPTVPVTGNGSGVAFKYASDGGTYIITNHHVIQDAKTITVRSATGQSWPGTVVGSDTDNDIAVVKIAGKLPIIQIGDYQSLRVGDLAVAIGSPFGLGNSVTSGIISALGRSLPDVGSSTTQAQPLVDAIQTDAAINPGNSGGALVDKQGRLIGINTAIYSESGSAAGIGFAVPVDIAMRVATEILAGTKVIHPFIGLSGTTIDSVVASQQKLPVQQGALVEQLIKGGGAEAAGVKVNDIITAADGKPVASMADLIGAVRLHIPGQTVLLTILRGGQTIKLNVKVYDRPADVSATVPSKPSTSTTP